MTNHQAVAYIDCFSGISGDMTIAACVAGAAAGADIIRVHDVAECRKAMLVADAIRAAR